MAGSVSESLRALLAHAIDYAGLFPPAELELAAAAGHYAQYRAGAHSWLLGSFVIPAARLPELHPLVPAPAQPWNLNVLVGPKIGDELAAIERVVASGLGRVDWIEARVSTAEQIRGVRERVPRRIGIYFEVPAGEPALLKAVRDSGCRAKLRTGGVAPEAFPAPQQVAAFIAECARLELPFKATAGLHHPVRGEHRTTYKDDSPRAVMHGFLNVLLGAVFARGGVSPDEIAEILEERSAAPFAFDPDGITWRYHRISNQQIRHARQVALISFGSCSFTEPVDELHSLGLL